MKKFYIRPKLALDFGTANCLIIREGKGVVLSEPTVVAIGAKDKKVKAVGAEAKKMLGREPKSLIVKRPLQNGGISHYKLAYILLEQFLDKALGKLRIISPEISVAVPSRLNSIEERALTKALEQYGSHKVTLFPEALAAAIGAKLPVDKSVGSMIINLGGGTAEIALISCSEIITSVSHIGTGDAFNKSIQHYIKDNMSVEISEQVAEEIKIRIAKALSPLENEQIIVSGKNISEGIPTTFTVSALDVNRAIKPVLEDIVNATKKALRDSPPELVADLTSRGIALSGGTALLQDIDVYLTKSLNVPCYVVDDPLGCVARGLFTNLNL